MAYIITNKIFLVYFLNLIAYILALALIFSSFIIVPGHSLRGLTNFSKVTHLGFTKFMLLISLLSLSGMPPFFGFFAKFFLFFFLTVKGNYALLLFFLFFNLFALYFYLSAVRFINQSATRKSSRVIGWRSAVPSGTAALWILLSWSLIFGFLFLEGIIILLCNIFA